MPAQSPTVAFLDAVWAPDDATQTPRRLTPPWALVRARTRAKNQIHAVLGRNLVERPPISGLFGRTGRVGGVRADHGAVARRAPLGRGPRAPGRHLSGEIDQLDQILAADPISHPEALPQMTLPGMSMVEHLTVASAARALR
jgi:hypothetical protein